ncbi:MAG: Phosphodiesterase YfcE [Syntrophaceae bacterium PtaU1.Bin231]|nr:MAG: Phosphodiesterase YfcE [Syntrophaceae bacterium PtaU1.Bin231]
MRIGVVSDTHLHCDDDGFRMLIEDRFAGVDLLLHAGDLVSPAVLEMFAGREYKAVCGNMDFDSVRQVLPERIVFQAGRFRIGLVHGWGGPEGIQGRLLDALGPLDCIVYGHTHVPENRRRDGVLFFNPGSARDRRGAAANTIGFLDIGDEIRGTILPV